MYFDQLMSAMGRISEVHPAYQARAMRSLELLVLLLLPLVWTEPVALEAAAVVELAALTEQAGAAHTEVVRGKSARRETGNMCNMLLRVVQGGG